MISSCVVPVLITSPTPGSMELTDRESYQVQFGNKTFTCLAEGYPEPSLYWYYNGDFIIGINGVIARGPELIISSQSYHSGIYQYLVQNKIGETTFVDQRAWILEVRVPSRKNKNKCSPVVL